MSAAVQQVAEDVDWSPGNAARTPAKSKARCSGAAASVEWNGMGDPSGTGAPAMHETCGSLLSRIVETEILPRLALTHSGAVLCPATTTTADDTAELVRLVLTREAPEAVAFMATLTLRGVSTETLFLGVISEAVRRLGEMWEEDLCDFVQVTISTGRLQQVMRALTPDFQLAAVRRPKPNRVLLMPAPGGQHTFGLVMLGEFFRRSGWHVGGGPAGNQDSLALVRGEHFDVVGFSVGSDSQVEPLSHCIRAVRRASRNRNVGVMVGGPLFSLRPDLALRVGADAAAADAPGAVQQAVALLAFRLPVA